jgi:hypothetical protein
MVPGRYRPAKGKRDAHGVGMGKLSSEIWRSSVTAKRRMRFPPGIPLHDSQFRLQRFSHRIGNMTCKHLPYRVYRTFRDGTTHLEERCRICEKHITYIPQGVTIDEMYDNDLRELEESYLA